MAITSLSTKSLWEICQLFSLILSWIPLWRTFTKTQKIVDKQSILEWSLTKKIYQSMDLKSLSEDWKSRIATTEKANSLLIQWNIDHFQAEIWLDKVMFTARFMMNLRIRRMQDYKLSTFLSISRTWISGETSYSRKGMNKKHLSCTKMG